MKIELNIKEDNYNSHPNSTIVFFEGQKYIHIKIDDREVSVDKESFKKLLNLF